MAKHSKQWLRLETLEEKVVPTVTALTNLDPQYYGDTGFGLSNLTAMPAQTQSMSADGQLVVFQSMAADLVPNDHNYQKDVFLYDRGRGTVRLISQNFLGTNSVNAGAQNPVISPDGRYIAFESQATDVVSGVSGAKVYLYDLQTNTMSVASQSTANVLNNNTAQLPLFTGDSEHLLYVSNATNLDASVTTVTGTNLFWRDLNTGVNKMVTVALNGTSSGGLQNGAGVYSWYNFSASSNGRYVAFMGNTDTFTTNDANGLEDVFRRDMQLGTTQLISTDTSGGFSANQHSSLNVNSISDDGQQVLFHSDASNLVTGDVNGSGDLFLRDLSGTPTTSAITVNSTGTMVGGSSGVLTPDGKYVAFVSSASNLVAGVTGQNVYRRDLFTGTTVLASRTPEGTGGNAVSGTSQYYFDFSIGTPLITPDGRYIAYASQATDLAGTDGNNAQANAVNRRDIFRADLTTNTNTLISTISGTTTGGNSASQSPAMSTDGRFFAFESLATNLVPGNADNNALGDVYVHDATSHLTEIASQHSPFLDETVAINASVDYTLDASPDGRFVLFSSTVKALTPTIPGVWHHSNSFVRDTLTGSVEAVSLLPNNTMGGVTGQFGSISTDGRFVVFVSSDPTYDASNTYSTGGVFLRDRQTGTNRLISRNTTTDTAVTGNIGEVTISRDGRYVAFTHTGQTMVNGVTYPLNDYNLFVYDRLSDTTRMVSVSPDGTTAGNAGIGTFHYEYFPRFSADGSKLLYVTNASNLVAGITDTNGRGDVFVYDTATQTNELVSVSTTPSETGNNESNQYDRPTISADGRYVAFTSNATNLTAIPGGNRQSYRRDLQTGTTILVSMNTAGTGLANNVAEWPQISADGSKIFFESYATNISSTPTGGFRHVFMRDLSGTPTTTLVSKNTAGTAGASGDVYLQAANRYDPMFRVSNDGRYVTYRSTATNLVADFVQPTTNTDPDVYVTDVQTGRTALIAWNIAGMAAAREGAGLYMLPGDAGASVIFNSYADDLTAGDRVGAGGSSYQDIFAATIDGHASIGGTVFHDVDGNGTQNSEPGLGFWTVYLDADNDGVYDAGERKALTDTNGNYRFTNLAAGNYTVAFKPLDGFTTTVPSGNHTYMVNLETETSSVTNQTFGVQQALADLTLDTVQVATTGILGDTISVSWLTRNLGSTAITADWQDAVYLSKDNVLDSSDILVGTLSQTQTLAGESSRSSTTTINLPALLPDEFHVLVQADRRRQVTNDSDRSNNLTISPNTLNVTARPLTLGTSVIGQFSAPNQLHYYQIDVPVGGTVILQLGTHSFGGGTIALYASRDRLPSTFDFDYAGRIPGRMTQVIRIPQVLTAGRYYLLAHSESGSAAISDYTISATQLTGLQLDFVDGPYGNTGLSTIEMRGANFTPTTVISVGFQSGGGTPLVPVAVDYRNPSLMYATFDFTDRPVSLNYLRVEEGLDATYVLFNIIEGATTNGLDIDLIVPADMRLGRETTVTIEYTNRTYSDMVAPLLEISAPKALFRHPNDPNFVTDYVQILAAGTSGQAGVLRPGETGRIRVQMIAKTTVLSGEPIDIEVRPLAHNADGNWDGAKAPSRPEHIPTDAWEAIWSNLLAEVGSTTNEYNARLAQMASYLGALGVEANNVGRLWSFLLSQANATLPTPSLSSAIDASMAAPGIGLSFGRAYIQSISRRYRLGILGRGWVTPWETALATDVDGNVTITTGGGLRFFSPKITGGYTESAGEYGTLTKSGSIYTLTEKDGSKSVYRADGLLDYIEDTNTNRITVGYDVAQRVSTLTHSSLPTLPLTLAYNSHGRVESVTDGANRVTSFVYDASGEHLIEVTDPQGTTKYEYLTGQGITREHALAHITYRDDTEQFFTYDAKGRLTGTHRDGGAQPLTFTYQGDGKIKLTDANNNTTTVWFNDGGGVEKAVDSLGRSVEYDYDALYNLTRTRNAAGLQSTYDYDSRGNMTRMLNPLGHVVEMSYSTGLNRLTKLQDARGKVTEYDYDTDGNLSSITYPNGGAESFTYDPLGNLLETVNRRGRTTSFDTDARGRTTRIDFQDGSFQEFTYDTHDNMLTATDANGTITMVYQPVTDYLTKITYADGRFLEFTYDAGGRRLTSLDQDGFKIGYVYDALGRLDKLQDSTNATIVEYTYDPAGRLVSKLNANGTSTTYAYDNAGQLLTIVNYAPGGVLENSRIAYTYDLLGRRATMTDGTGTTEYGYDVLGQLTRVELPGGRLITYEYDDAGNRQRMVDDGVETLYTVDDENQILKAGSTSYTYDADGNLLTQTDGSGTTNYVFNDLNQLVSFNGPGGASSFEYNPLGNRTAATRGGLRTEYLHDPAGLGNVVGEYGPGNTLIANYAHGFGLVARYGPGGTGFFDYDGNANTIGITNASGNYVNRYNYLPFGETTTTLATLHNPFAFVGEAGVMHETNNLSYMRARYYGTSTGQFLSNDPIGLDSGDVNLRRYVGNNPVSFNDPTGLIILVVPKGSKAQYDSGDDYIPASGVTEPVDAGTITKSLPDRNFNDAFDMYSRANTTLHQEYYDQLRKENNVSSDPKVGRMLTDMSKMAAVLNIVNGQPAPQFCTKANPSPAPSQMQPVFGSCQGPTAGKPAASGSSRPRGSFDPNDIQGPSGYDDELFIRPEGTWGYTIRFENKDDAATAAQDVKVTHQLDADLDWSSFEIGSFGFGSLQFNVPAGLKQYTKTIAYQNEDGTPLRVDASFTFDADTGLLTVEFFSLDPATGEFPAAVDAGFLPPNDATGRGEGFIQYTVKPKSTLVTNTSIDQQATIVFDVNAPILTNIFTNTIDSDVPTVTLDAPPATSNRRQVPLSWSAADLGAGIAKYNVYVATDGGAEELYRTTTATTTTLVADGGHTYSVRVEAVDHVGLATFSNVQETEITADANRVFKVILEDNKANVGLTGTQLLGTWFNDFNTGGKRGVAITGLNGNGTWQFSLNGKKWNSIVSASPTNALLLLGTQRVRFIPAANWNGTATVDYVAWDLTNGTAGQFADTTTSAHFSTLTERAYQEVKPVNDAPVLVTNKLTMLPSMDMNAPANLGIGVGELLADRASDVDHAQLGIAVTRVSGKGTWEYSLDGLSWFTLKGVSSSKARMLDETARVRFTPATDYVGLAQLGYRAWDGTLGTLGTTTRIRSTAFSKATEYAQVAIGNTAPVLDNSGSPTFTPILVNQKKYVGQTVKSLLGASVTDSLKAKRGIAITGLSGDGTWQYLQGTKWLTITATPNSALLLSENHKLRFLPTANAVGTATITYKAWDQTVGKSGEFADTTHVQASSFSLLDETATLAINPV